MSKIYKLKLLQDKIKIINNKYPNLNYGACGTFSYYLSETLDKLGIDNQIVYIKEKIKLLDFIQMIT